MDIKPVIIWGLACVALTGCQSYYPKGYGHYGPYSQFPTGTYIDQGNSSSGAGGRGYPTPVNQKNSGTNRSDSGDEGDAKPVPKYNSPDGAPNSLGAPSQDDEDDGVNKRRKTGSLNSSGSGGELVLSEGAERSGRSMAAVEDDGFVTPVEFRDAAPVTADREPRRLKQKSVPSPYKKDPDGYAWLRGVVTRDAKSGLWRLTYSREPLDDDPYQGSLSLADDESLDILTNGDVVLVEGQPDESQLDRFKKPVYRVSHLEGPLKPKAE